MSGPDKPKGQWLRLSTMVLTDPDNAMPSDAALFDAIGAAFGPWTMIYGLCVAPMPPAAPDAQASLTAARALLTDAVLLFRGYEAHHREQAEAIAEPGDPHAQLQAADRMAKAERNADIAERIERWLASPGGAWGAGYVAPPAAQPATSTAGDAARHAAMSAAAAEGPPA